jgi:glycerol uptake operon antiterminator
VLYGTVVDIADIVCTARAAGKAVIVHIDLIDGLAARDVAVDFIVQNTKADGIISTKPALVRRAKEKGLVGIRRFFLLDSLAMCNMEKQLAADTPDLVEVLPGTMPKTLRQVVAKTQVPIIAGGLIADKEDVVNALSAGAVAVSSTNAAVWNI